jgi:hypothetical protein
MPDTLISLRRRDVGTTRLQLQTLAGADYSVPAGGKALIIGMSCCNDSAAEIGATIEIGAGATFTRLLNGARIPANVSLGPIGSIGKTGLEAGEGVYATSTAATSLDMLVTILEITP